MSNQSIQFIQGLLVEQASAPAAPASGSLQLWSKTDHTLHIQTSGAVDLQVVDNGANTFVGLQTFNAGIAIAASQAITGNVTNSTISGFLSVAATTFTGALTGNASTATTATNFNNGTSSSSAGTVTATTFTGTNLGGTLSTAAQPNVTSLGTLTAALNSSYANPQTGAFSFTASTGTNGAGGNFFNTGGALLIGIDTSTSSGITSSGNAYDAAVWYTGNHTLAFGTNNTLRFSITGAGAASFGSNSLTAGAISGTTGAFSSTISTVASSGTGTAVIIDGSNILRPLTSSERFKTILKRNWQPTTGQLSSFLALTPILARYNTDDSWGPMLGYSAEDLAKVDKHLVNYDKGGLPYSIREHAVLSYHQAALTSLAARITALGG